MINYYSDEYWERPFQKQSILKVMWDKLFKNGPSVKNGTRTYL